MTTTDGGADPVRFLEVLDRLRETFGLYDQAATLAEGQVRDAMAAADRIRREAEADAVRIRAGAGGDPRLQAELDSLRRERDQLIAAGEAQERQFSEEIAALHDQVSGMAEAIEDLVRRLEQATSGSPPLRSGRPS